jgi:hypothetical protein
MTVDSREKILARLYTVLQSVEGVKGVTRNRGEIADAELPGVIFLDGDETSATELDNPGSPKMPKGIPPNRPDVIRLMPEIYIKLNLQKPHSQQIGPELNTLRCKIVKALVFDATLIDLIGPNGSIRYQGCTTDLARGRAMEGMMQVHMAVLYVFRPNEL